MDTKLVLDRDKLDRMRKLGNELARHVQKFTDRHSSRSIECATLAALGVSARGQKRSLAARVVDKLNDRQLRQGAAYWLGAVMLHTKYDAQKAAKLIARKGLPKDLPRKLPHSDIRKVTREALQSFQDQVKKAAKERQPWRRNDHRGEAAGVITVLRTGKAGDDLAALRLQCARHVAGVILRPPLSADDEFLCAKGRGWFAKYDVSEVLQKASRNVCAHNGQVDPPTHLIWSCQHLSAPELCAQLATSGVSAIEYDWLTMTRVGGVHAKRALVDQHFIYRLMAKAEIDVAVASDHWFDAGEGHARSHELLVGQQLIESMGSHAGLDHGAVHVRHELMLHHEQAEAVAGHVAHEVAHAQLLRELFPQAPLRLNLPVESDYAMLAAGVQQLCHFAAVVLDGIDHRSRSAQRVRSLVNEIAEFQGNTAGLAQDLQFVPNGKIHRRGNMLLDRAHSQIEKLQRRDFLTVLSEERNGLFACEDKGSGLDGVFSKHRYYWNPFDEWFTGGRRRRRAA